MNSFLQEVANRLAESGVATENLTVVFPNRRAAIYFQQYLGKALKNPAWSPHLLTIEEFFRSKHAAVQPDKLELLAILHRVHGEVMEQSEPFDRFYFWGDMLLRDFDEVDKYLVNAPLLFRDLSHLKELDESFDYLTEDQRKFLMEFWSGFRDHLSGSKESFLRVWRRLPEVYRRFVAYLTEHGLAYEGMIHRAVAEKIRQLPGPENNAFRNFHFVGFNALTTAEEVVLAYHVSAGASVWWDEDAYYVGQATQEAGDFLRSYRQHPILGKTFSADPPALLLEMRPGHTIAGPRVTMTGVPQRVGQARLVGERLSEATDKEPVDERTVIVIPDESMLMPVLHSLSPAIPSFNVTMGYPLQHTPLYHLLDLCIELQWQRKGDWFSHAQVVPLLNHAYMAAFAGEQSRHLSRLIVKENRVLVPPDFFVGTEPLMMLIFRHVPAARACEYLLQVVEYLGASFETGAGLDREYAYHFHRQLARLQEVLAPLPPTGDERSQWHGFARMFRQLMLAQKIPFSGEPVRGLQIMGVLETRNLDFEHVHILGLNEGIWPAAPRRGSYIPHSIRKAYALPTFEHQDAMYAYLFYRLLQRATTVDLYYNTEPDQIGDGEMSRYLQQLLYESGLTLERKILHQPVLVDVAAPITVQKTQAVLEQLSRYCQTGEQLLSPSALNDYKTCGLRFYLKYLAGLRMPDEVEDDLDARVAGNIIHYALQLIYQDAMDNHQRWVTPDWLRTMRKDPHRWLDQAFRKHFGLRPEESVAYEGERLVVREIAKEIVDRILHLDEAYAPFELISIEDRHTITLPVGAHVVNLGGRVDRIDKKDNSIRIIDYKTGGDKSEFAGVASLFEDPAKANKAAFQTLFYAWLCAGKWDQSVAIVPGLFGRLEIFEEPYEFGLTDKSADKAVVKDARPLLAEYGKRLTDLVSQLFDPALPFVQTDEIESCDRCDFKGICRR
ncbi:MAG: PD-(D/E)XK nuclease family protein [Cyclobacteriaceae bacterium]